MNQLLTLFEKVESNWHRRITQKVVSNILIIGFAAGLIIAFISHELKPAFLHREVSYFLAVDIAFTILLIIEILGLVFVLPHSVAGSVGKQFEILSIILLRSAFKEFGKFEEPLTWTDLQIEPLYHILSDAFGALFIFLIIGFYYRAQKHIPVTESVYEQSQFVRFKKLIAIFLLLAFIYIGVLDVIHFASDGIYSPSFNIFYSILIFSDILILLYSLRFDTRYYNLFRYSSFALATILIRMSLIAPAYINMIIGLLAGLFVLGLTYAYNNFLKGKSNEIH